MHVMTSTQKVAYLHLPFWPVLSLRKVSLGIWSLETKAQVSIIQVSITTTMKDLLHPTGTFARTESYVKSKREMSRGRDVLAHLVEV